MDLISCVYKLRPDVTWKDNIVNGHSLETIEKTYQSSQALPTIEECEAVEAEIESDNNDKTAIESLKTRVKENDQWLFRMVLELFEVGKSKSLWQNSDFDDDIKQKAAVWKGILTELSGYGE